MISGNSSESLLYRVPAPTNGRRLRYLNAVTGIYTPDAVVANRNILLLLRDINGRAIAGKPSQGTYGVLTTGAAYHIFWNPGVDVATQFASSDGSTVFYQLVLWAPCSTPLEEGDEIILAVEAGALAPETDTFSSVLVFEDEPA